MRKPCEIAWDILQIARTAVTPRGVRPAWVTYSMPYLRTMLEIDSMTQTYMAEDARSIVLYARSNLASWRGAEAKALKAELDQLLTPR